MDRENLNKAMESDITKKPGGEQAAGLLGFFYIPSGYAAVALL
jgi:hypothetical protein